MAYDRADWHYGGDFPKGLPPENGGTHIGMFLAWAILHGLEGELHREESQESLSAVRERRMTGCQFLFKECDEKFTDEDLNVEGNAFAKHYYQSNQYLGDYERILGKELPSLYHAQDTWENYDRLAPVIDQKFKDWKGKSSGSAWWKFWS